MPVELNRFAVAVGGSHFLGEWEILEFYDSITSKTHRRDPAPWILT